MERELYEVTETDREDAKKARELLRRKPVEPAVPFDQGLANIRRLKQQIDAALEENSNTGGFYGKKTGTRIR